MIIVWGKIEIKPEHTEEALEVGVEHVRRSRLEPGCMTHSVQIDGENKQCLVFYEEWEDMNALQVHFKVPESGAFVKNISALATGEPTMKIYEAAQIK